MTDDGIGSGPWWCQWLLVHLSRPELQPNECQSKQWKDDREQRQHFVMVIDFNSLEFQLFRRWNSCKMRVLVIIVVLILQCFSFSRLVFAGQGR